MNNSASLLAVLAFAFSGDASAQVLVAPDEVALRIHTEIADTDFVEGLVCELSRVLAAPVQAERIEMPLNDAYRANARQYDTAKLGTAFARATRPTSGRVFRHLVISSDLTAQGLNYAYSETSLGSETAAVLSINRLVPMSLPWRSRKQASDILGRRVYNLMLKSVAILSGLRTRGCVMSFPNNLDELDKRAPEFCPDDRAALVRARVLRDRPMGACNTVAMLAQ